MTVSILDETLRQLAANDIIPRIWAKDPTVWGQPAQDSHEIVNRLGWLASPGQMQAKVGEILAFAQRIREERFSDIVLLGMGGSSLASYVLARAFPAMPEYPRLHMLDSTVPAAILACEARIDLSRTLFIVASKSGGTIETLSLYKHFWARVSGIADAPGRHFVVITDPNSDLETLARKNKFRAVFLNPSDIGGRYSAISLFGLVPAALIGMDIGRLLQTAEAMAAQCGPQVPLAKNGGAVLGAFMGAHAMAGQDKLTLVISPPIAEFGLWAEQLVAESTGKDGKGILPVCNSSVIPTTPHTADRAYIYIRFGGDTTFDVAIDALARAGAPVFHRDVRDPYDLGAEFYCWEMATTVAGHLLGIHPFNQPSVALAKRTTSGMLEAYKRDARLPDSPPDWSDGDMFLCGTGVEANSLESGLRPFFASIKSGDYCALLAYLAPDSEWNLPLAAIQQSITECFGTTATVGYGPRYLHSTGQLHKGGPATGHFIILTADDPQDVSIPGESYSFSVLKSAQAQGDLETLRSLGRPAIHIHLGQDIGAGLQRVQTAIAAALGK